MIQLLVRKKNFNALFCKQIVFLLAILFLFTSCSQPKKEKVSSIKFLQDEKKWMERFFQDLLLEENGIYTLWGSKPITCVVMYYYTEEEIKAFNDQMTEEEKKTCLEIETHDFEKNWAKWERVQQNFPMNRYLLFKRADSENSKIAYVYFVDILKTAFVLQENYEILKQDFGEDFNPFDVACEFKNENSIFWKKISGNSAILGMLFGYGKKNSWAFHWKYYDHHEKFDYIAQSIPFHFSDESRCGKATLNDFSLPIFASFSDSKDPIIQKYEEERKEIKKIYQNQEFLELTLEKLLEPNNQ